MDSTLLEIDELLQKINYNKFLYYFKNGEGCISDQEYDLLVLKFKSLVNSDPRIKNKYGDFINLPNFTTDLPLIKHKKRILSLDNLYSYEELIRWHKYLSRIIEVDEVEFFLTPKIDGLFINLIYKNGGLNKVLTRYDGNQGEDITLTVKQIPNIPKELLEKEADIEIHGELFLNKENYTLILIESLKKAYNELYKIVKLSFLFYQSYTAHLEAFKSFLTIKPNKDSSITQHYLNRSSSHLLQFTKISNSYEAFYKSYISRKLNQLYKLKGVSNMRNMASGIARANLFNLIVSLRDYLYSFKLLCKENRDIDNLILYVKKMIDRVNEIIQRIDGTAKYKNLLSFIPHGLGASSIKIKTLEEFHKFAVMNNFLELPEQYKTKNIKELYNYIDQYDDRKFKFESDGIVIAVNDLSLQAGIGNTGNSPRGMRSYKIQPNARKSFIKEISFHLGRTGILTPVAIIDQIKDYQNSNIENVTLHNASLLITKNIRVGDQVMVIKSGNVIPKIIKHIPKRNLTSEEKENYTTLPSTCYACKGRLSYDETFLKCSNLQCKGRLLAYFNYVCNRKILDINIGVSMLKYLVTFNICRGIYDLLNLEYDSIKYLLGKGGYLFSNKNKDGVLFASKTCNNLLNSIKKAKQDITPMKALLLLNIPALGRENAKEIAKKIVDLEDLFTINLKQIHGIGEELEKAVLEFLKIEDNLAVLRYLDKIMIKNKEKKVENDQIKICITGKLSKPREEFKREYPNYSFVDYMNNEVDYLLIGELKNTSSKYRFAKKHNIPIIKEDHINRLDET